MGFLASFAESWYILDPIGISVDDMSVFEEGSVIEN